MGSTTWGQHKQLLSSVHNTKQRSAPSSRCLTIEGVESYIMKLSSTTVLCQTKDCHSYDSMGCSTLGASDRAVAEAPPPRQPLQFDQAIDADLGIALHHNVVDVSLQRHADVLPLLGVKLEDVQHPSHSHLEEHRLAAAAELHDVSQLGRVQVLLGHRSEEVHAALVDAQDELGREQPNGVLYPLHSEEDRVACSKAAGKQSAQQCSVAAKTQVPAHSLGLRKMHSLSLATCL